MPEETIEVYEKDEGFSRGWNETVRTPLSELRGKSRAWVEGYMRGVRMREQTGQWGGHPETSGAPYLPAFCVLRRPYGDSRMLRLSEG